MKRVISRWKTITGEGCAATSSSRKNMPGTTSRTWRRAEFERVLVHWARRNEESCVRGEQCRVYRDDATRQLSCAYLPRCRTVVSLGEDFSKVNWILNVKLDRLIITSESCAHWIAPDWRELCECWIWVAIDETANAIRTCKQISGARSSPSVEERRGKGSPVRRVVRAQSFSRDCVWFEATRIDIVQVNYKQSNIYIYTVHIYIYAIYGFRPFHYNSTAPVRSIV